MSSENDFLQPNTGDFPMETIDNPRKLTKHLNLCTYSHNIYTILFLI